jgi:pentose-5-phosphate-3-epimerase
VSVPVSVEGQLTPANAAEVLDLGADILVLGSVFDIAIEDAIKRVVDEFCGDDRAPRRPGAGA